MLSWYVDELYGVLPKSLVIWDLFWEEGKLFKIKKTQLGIC